MDTERLTQWLREMALLGIDDPLPSAREELLPILEGLRVQFRDQQREIDHLQAMLAFFWAALNAQPNPVFIKDEQLRFVFLNQKYREFFNLGDDHYLGKQVMDLEYLPEEDRLRYHREDSQMLATQSTLQYETAFLNPDNQLTESMYWSRGFRVPSTGQRGLIGEIVDISDQRKLQRELARHAAALEQISEEIRQKSKLDPGTQVYNRRILTDELPALLAQAERDSFSVCFLLTDIDDFKYINDTYGHLEGDSILSRFADVMKSTLRYGDITIRYGGDEFAAVLVKANVKQAADVAERFRDRICRELSLPGGEPVTISVGVTEYHPGEDFMAFFGRTDEALYAAKKSGKNKVVAVP